MTEDWIRKERKRLAQQLTASTWKGLVVSIPLVTLVSIAFYFWVVTQYDLLPGAEHTLAALVATFALPGAVFVFVGLRRVFWQRAIRGELNRMRSQKFVSEYVDQLGGEAALHAHLSVVAKAQIDRVLKREQEDEQVNDRDYAAALRYLLLLEPLTEGSKSSA
ncbi:hypothetical protein CKO15_07805 [Halorhodospira abdelmalekii]|uniref:hypothetical protein n=1 Tax=Halorhodospira abdelmalekii TaxID=421629 RepID=UPI0019037759|nr:hypothetical protein [Halorhodospira abdelmalekii]MBK1735189.1 hypothetical protein [Halorhodospira abdelmalekii]